VTLKLGKVDETMTIQAAAEAVEKTGSMGFPPFSHLASSIKKRSSPGRFGQNVH